MTKLSETWHQSNGLKFEPEEFKMVKSPKSQLLAHSVLAALAASPALAVAAEGAASAGDPATPTVELTEVIVSAQKRSERLQDVPISISVLDASSLAERNSVAITDYFATVPGLSVAAESGGQMNLSIRGLTTGGNTNPTVSATVDDVPIGSTSALTYATFLTANIDPSSLERIEVLRGPQGTLYGASNLGGLLRYVTAPPRMNEFSGRVQLDGTTVTGGSQGFGLRGAVNLPMIDDKFAATLSGFYRHDPGFVDNYFIDKSDVNEADVYGGRVAALWQPTENVSLRVSAVYQETNGDGSSDIEADANLQPTDGQLAHQGVPGSGTYDRKLQQYDATLKVDFGGVSLTSVTGYGESNFLEKIDHTRVYGGLTEYATGLTDVGTVTYLSSDTRKFSQEIRLSSISGQRFEWLLGAFYTHEDSRAEFNIYATDLTSGEIVAPVFPDSFPSSVEEYAGFATGTYHFTDKFDVQFGGRYSRNSQVFDEYIGGPLYDPPYVDHEESEDSSTTFLFSPRYRFSPGMMTYLRIASGYRPGGPNPGAIFTGGPSSYDADTTISYEAGLKGAFADNRVTLDLAAYYVDWNDIQLQQRDPETNFVYFSNGGKASTKGLEVIVKAAPATGLSLTGTFGYIDATLSEPSTVGIIASAGDRLPYSAKWNWSLSIEQEFSVGSEHTGYVGLDLAYVGDRLSYFSTTANLPRSTIPAYTTIDLRAGISVAGWRIGAYARNLTNERGILSAEPEAASGRTGIYLLNIITPRCIGLSVSRDF